VVVDVLDAVGYTSLFSPDTVLPCAAVCLTPTNDRGPDNPRLPLLISNLTLAASSRQCYAYAA
jgi:hypothetical protein